MNLFGFQFGFRNGSAHEGASSTPNRRSPNGPRPTDAKNELPAYTRDELVRRARWADKNSGMARAIARDHQLYAIGDGIRAQAATENPEWNRKAEKLWRDWSREADITRRYSLTQLLHIVSRTIDRDGEVFVVKSRNRFGRPALQLIEAHRCADGESPLAGMVDGVAFDEFGAPATYRFIRDDGSARDVPAAAVCHLHEPDAISASRARPFLAHGLNSILDEAEIVAANKKGVKDQLRVARLVTTAQGTAESAGPAFGSVPAADGSVSADEIDARLGFGATAVLPNGSGVTNLMNNLPNPTFQGFLEWIRREVSSGALPYEFVQDPSKVGGAAVRLVVGKADRAFSHRQLLIIEQLLEKVWPWVIADFIARGELEAAADFWRSAWVTPRRVTVDAGRDANANREDVKVGLKTLSDDFAERGMDYEEELRRRARDAQIRKRIAAEFGVSERDLYDPAPNNAQPAQPVQPSDQEPQQ